MGRYSIALNKTLEEIAKERGEKIVQFGLDQDVDFQRHQRTFYLEKGQKTRLGIVFEDPKTLFYASKVHFYNGRRFFCKSTSHANAVCCSTNYPGRTPALRMATIVTVYPNDPVQKLMSSVDSIKVIPWVFGKIMFNKIKELNKCSSIDKHDFIVSLENYRTGGFKSYDLSNLSKGSLWQQSPSKERILEIFRHLSRTIKSYIAEENLDESTIRDFINSEQSRRVFVSDAVAAREWERWERETPQMRSRRRRQEEEVGRQDPQNLSFFEDL